MAFANQCCFIPWTEEQLLQSLVTLPEFVYDDPTQTHIVGPALLGYGAPPLPDRSRTLYQHFAVDFNQGITFRHGHGEARPDYLAMWRALLHAFLHLLDQTQCQAALTLTNGEQVDLLWQDGKLVLNAGDPWNQQHIGAWLMELGRAYELKDIPY